MTAVAQPTPPPPRVRRAFGATGPPRLLDGGERRTWRCGDVICKPVGDVAESVWRAAILDALPESRLIRVARPVRADDGAWTYDGWEAWRPLDGVPDPRRLADVRWAGTEFHALVATVPRPVFLDTRDNRWTYGDRVAFADADVPDRGPWADPLRRLATARQPLPLPNQPVHGDLLGNVLFAPGAAPAIIDWAVYFRPAVWADAVAVVDAVVWHDARLAALAPADVEPDVWRQALIRALMYRMATNVARGHERPDDYRPVLDVVLGDA
ncbi:MAG TPA: TIGR02569 family protein [Micromonosporaceae bacterium]|nr:TIGR02569 family protein [Micromonosporaceae bacterium]